MIGLGQVSARAGAFALEDISFEIPDGAHGVVIGPAGAGKTTLLETIAGIIRPTAGTVTLAGRDLTHAPPERRPLGMVYQHAYLFPHLSVRENVAYGAVSPAAAAEAAERFGVAALAGRRVVSLSGGERQLVALARALARQPRILLLDEPFAALDPRTRSAARHTLRALHAERGFTVLQVTHDLGEAGLVGDVAIVLDRGRIVQQGHPEQVFREPATPYVADFLGAENILAGTVGPLAPVGTGQPLSSDDLNRGGAGAGPRPFARHDSASDERTRMGGGVAFTTGAITLYATGDVPPGPAHAVIRAEEISLAPEPSVSSVRNQLRGTIRDIVSTGALARVTVDVSGTPIVAAVTTRSVRELGLAPGMEIVAAFKATAVHLC